MLCHLCKQMIRWLVAISLMNGVAWPLGRDEQTASGAVVLNVFIPLVMRNYIAYYVGNVETEPNNTAAQADGPLRSGQAYQGTPNDDRDYFSVYLPVAGTINVTLTGDTGLGVQLQLFYQTAGNVVAFDTVAPYQLSYSGGPGLYYIYIFSAGPYSSTTGYDLVVTYPTE